MATTTPLGRVPPAGFASVSYPAAGFSTTSVSAIAQLSYTGNDDTLSIKCTSLVLDVPSSSLRVNGGVNISTDIAVKQSSQFWSTPSDRRIKDRIRTVEPAEADASLRRYRVARYHYAPAFVGAPHGFPAAEQMGLIADEVLETHPQAVHVHAEPVYGLDHFKTVNPHTIFYEMLAVVQAHSARIAELESRLEAHK